MFFSVMHRERVAIGELDTPQICCSPPPTPPHGHHRRRPAYPALVRTGVGDSISRSRQLFTRIRFARDRSLTMATQMPLIQICSQIIQNKIAWDTSILAGFAGMNRLSGSESFGLDLPSVLAFQGHYSRYSPLVHAYMSSKSSCMTPLALYSPCYTRGPTCTLVGP